MMAASHCRSWRQIFFQWFSLQKLLGSILPSTSCENPCYIQQSINCMMKLTCNNAIIVQILFFLPADFFWLWLFHHQDQCQNNCFIEVPQGQGQFLKNNQKSFKMAKQLPKWQNTFSDFDTSIIRITFNTNYVWWQKVVVYSQNYHFLSKSVAKKIKNVFFYLQTFSDFDCSIIRINVKIIAVWKSCGVKAISKPLRMGIVTIIGHNLNNLCTL